MKPSARIIYRALQRGEVLTPIISLTRYGVHALSQRVGEIRRDPEVDEEIVSERVVNDVYHRYFMPKHCKVVSTPRPEKTIPVREHVRRVAIADDSSQGVLFTWR